MNGIHDMGGMHGFGAVVVEKDEPVFHARWEGVVRALMNRTAGRYYHLDEFRHAIERMPPAEYIEAGYYERWLYALEELLVDTSLAQRGEDGPRPAVHARFAPGDRVRTRNLNPKGHTRLPRYVRGKRGVVRTVSGPFLLPDKNAHGVREWQPCYAVEFSARELWGEGAGERDRVCVDLWEAYLEEDE
ncbi:MAG TPA: SH3-like domain-containing protein [Candidatus Dormibacteraeota bacterium]